MPKKMKIRIALDNSEHVVDGNLHTLHAPKDLDRKSSSVTYDPKRKRIFFKDKNGIFCWTPDNIQPLETRLPSEDFCVWNGVQLDQDGHPVFWLAELIRWDDQK